MSSETLHYAIYYHLGLAHYLKGDFENALKVYRQCLAVAKGNDDQTAGASDWLYMTLRRLGRADEAAKVLDTIVPGMKVKDDQQYYDRLQMYKGLYAPEDLLRAGGDPISAATLRVRRRELVSLQRAQGRGEGGLRADRQGTELDAVRLHRGGGGTGADEIDGGRPHRGSRGGVSLPGRSQISGVIPGTATGSTGFGPNSYFAGDRSSVDVFIAHSHDIARPV